MCYSGFEEGTPPAGSLAASQLRTSTRDEQALQPTLDILIKVVELTRRIARPKVRSPAAHHRVHLTDDDADVGVTPPSRGELSDPSPHVPIRCLPDPTSFPKPRTAPPRSL